MHFLFLNERFAPDVSEQPHVDLHHWRLFKAASGEVHLSAEIAPGTMRITTPLVAVELAQGCCITLSGRRYQLCGPPEGGELLRALLQANAERSGLAAATDVSDTIWAQISAHAHVMECPLQDAQ